MNCLILAAGYGSRLRELSDSKPLTAVGGVPLIEHVMRRAAEGGASAFTVVTGHMAERVEAAASAAGARLGLAVRPVRLADWSRPNGHSVLAGAATIDGDYLLTMSDHLFDPGIVRALLAAPRAGVTLAIDRDRAGPLIDLDDATKVDVAADGAIRRIGKTIARWNAIDTGVFVASPELAQALREVVAEGAAGSLSEGVQRLAGRGQAGTVDVTGRRWLDVDDPRAHALAQDFVRHG